MQGLFRIRSSHRHVDLKLLVVRMILSAIIAMLIYSVCANRAYPSEISTDENVIAHAEATQPWQSLASIRAAAEQYIRSRSPHAAHSNSSLSAIAAELDSRLQVKTCDGALDTFALNAAALAARNTVGVRCKHNVQWTVYVPVNVESDLDVFVLRNSLQREAHVAASDLEKQRRHVAGFGDAYITDLTTLGDMHLKRPLNAGSVLTTADMTRDLLVKRGQQVLLVIAANGLAIQAPGLALSEGGIDDRIRVQNQSSLKVVEGKVESATLVRVGM